MGERIGRIRRIETDFWVKMHEFQAKRFLRNDKKKSVSIRPIRSPIVSPFSKAETADSSLLTNIFFIFFESKATKFKLLSS
jgi:hypothetical protein